MSQPTHVAILNYPNAMASAVYGVADLLSIANLQAGREHFVWHNVVSNKRVKDGAPRPDILLVPPCLSKTLPDFDTPDVLVLIRDYHRAGVVIMAACAGVFWLANAGVLDGKKATTHWLLCDALERRYPAIKGIRRQDMVVDQGEVVTAAGLYAFQDLTLHLIARFAGYALASRVANFALLDFKGRMQSYYQRFYPRFDHNDEAVLKAQRYCDENIHESLSIESLAEVCHLSHRTLLRRFKNATGYSPKQYLIQLKIEKAKQMLELDTSSLETVAYKLGYSDTSNFIKIFKKTAGLTPAEFLGRIRSK